MQYPHATSLELSKNEEMAAAVSSCLQELKDKRESAAATNVKVDVGMVGGTGPHLMETDKTKITTLTCTTGHTAVVTSSGGGNGTAARKSGIRMCKPQGAILLPADMGTAGICVRPSAQSQRGLLSVVPSAIRAVLAAGLPTPRLPPRSGGLELVAIPSQQQLVQMQRPTSNHPTTTLPHLRPTSFSVGGEQLLAAGTPLLASFQVPPASAMGFCVGEEKMEVAASWESPGGRPWCDINTDMAAVARRLPTSSQGNEFGYLREVGTVIGAAIVPSGVLVFTDTRGSLIDSVTRTVKISRDHDKFRTVTPFLKVFYCGKKQSARITIEYITELIKGPVLAHYNGDPPLKDLYHKIENFILSTLENDKKKNDPVNCLKFELGMILVRSNPDGKCLIGFKAYGNSFEYSHFKIEPALDKTWIIYGSGSVPAIEYFDSRKCDVINMNRQELGDLGHATLNAGTHNWRVGGFSKVQFLSFDTDPASWSLVKCEELTSSFNENKITVTHLGEDLELRCIYDFEHRASFRLDSID